MLGGECVYLHTRYIRNLIILGAVKFHAPYTRVVEWVRLSTQFWFSVSYFSEQICFLQRRLSGETGSSALDSVLQGADALRLLGVCDFPFMTRV
ncbi:hypothetical protein NDU88_005066 [Pleurodeles waltl]|uniref:Uncharacterized protein n=1 Tax=Pleurodeles waltl TaxID=8319 RepID=A0AAV7UGY4_PLEWA|nr:hypothetical protein NDU88_005066 [Pleurodeles waltl]